MSMPNLREIAERITYHYYCDDSCNGTNGAPRVGTPCYCGREQRVEILQIELEKVYQIGYDEGYSAG